MKKGEFNFLLFIMTIMVFGILILGGIKFAGNISDSAEDSKVQDFKRNLETDLKKVGSEYGSRSFVEYELPEKYYMFCLFDSDNSAEALQSKVLQKYPLAWDAIKANPKLNMILSGDDFEFFESEKIQIRDWPFYSCKEIDRGNLSMEFLGQGSYVTLPFTNIAEKKIDNEKFVIRSVDNVARVELENGISSIVSGPVDNEFFIILGNSPGQDSLSDEYMVTSGYDFKDGEASFIINLYSLFGFCKEENYEFDLWVTQDKDISGLYDDIPGNDPERCMIGLEMVEMDCETGDLVFNLDNTIC